MFPETTSPTALRDRLRACLSVPGILTLLALTYIVAFHSIASSDRLLLNLYYIGIAGVAYALVKRRAFAMMVLVISVAAGTTLAQVYFSSVPESYDPLLDPIRDFAAWSVLLFLCWRLAMEAYYFQTEERRMQVQRIIEEKTMAMRAAALTSTSHEVRTPLSAILAISETLLHETAGPLNEIQKDFLTDIDTSATHLMNLINDILDYAKAEAGMIELSPEAVALPELVAQCVAMVEPRAEEGQISITTQVEADIKEVVADPLRLKQILLNLLSNAVKFNDKNGLINVSVRASSDDVIISVRDTGRGISEEQQENLFDPYYQAIHTDQGIGTGLGLSIIKHLAELHAGTITVDSVLGTGSVFTVSLPRGSSRPAGHGKAPRKRNTSNTRKTKQIDELQEVTV